MNRIIIREGRLIDPSQRFDKPADILIENGVVAGIFESGASEVEDGDRIIEAAGLWVVPGLIDVHVHLRDPGQEHKENIESGCRAAAAGGFTTVCCMPNTSPVIDSVETVEYIINKAAEANGVRVLPSGCITMAQNGETITDMAALKAAGVCGFSEDGRSVDDPLKLREGMLLAKSLDMPIFDHTESRELAFGGSMNKGKISEALGIKGIPHEAEEIIAVRDMLLAKETGCRIHISHVSSAGTMDLIRLAKSWGVKVTAETAPHYLLLTDEAVRVDLTENVQKTYNISETPSGELADSHKKMNPPLRSESDRQAAVKALEDGTLDMIATDHAPHSINEKSASFEKSPFGVIGLETSFAASYTQLVLNGNIEPMRLIELMSSNPAKLLGKGGGSLKIGERADIAIIDPEHEWTVPEHGFESKAENTPFAGMSLKGKVRITIAAGNIIYEYEERK